MNLLFLGGEAGRASELSLQRVFAGSRERPVAFSKLCVVVVVVVDGRITYSFFQKT
jgi:hypothetical protein